MSRTRVVIHVSDWNFQDKYYDSPVEIARDFVTKIKELGMEDAWQWWVNQVDYGDSLGKPIKRDKVDMSQDVYFLDYQNPIESVDEWEDL